MCTRSLTFGTASISRKLAVAVLQLSIYYSDSSHSISEAAKPRHQHHSSQTRRFSANYQTNSNTNLPVQYTHLSSPAASSRRQPTTESASQPPTRTHNLHQQQPPTHTTSTRRRLTTDIAFTCHQDLIKGRQPSHQCFQSC